MLSRQPEQIRTQQNGKKRLTLSRDLRRAFQPLSGDLRKTATVQFNCGIKTAHGFRAQPAFQSLQRSPGLRMPLRQIHAIDQQGLIRRKYLPVITQQFQSLPRNLRIGGVDVDEINLLPGQSRVGQTVFEAADLQAFESVSRTQGRLTVAPVEKLR